MVVFITYDANHEAGLDQVLHSWNHKEMDSYFGKKDYGEDLIDVSIVLMCRDPEYNFKQRIRFSKNEKRLYMDLMLHLPDVVKLSLAQKKYLIATKICGEIPPRIRKYKFKDFDVDRFETDLRAKLREQGWFVSNFN